MKTQYIIISDCYAAIASSINSFGQEVVDEAKAADHLKMPERAEVLFMAFLIKHLLGSCHQTRIMVEHLADTFPSADEAPDRIASSQPV